MTRFRHDRPDLVRTGLEVIRAGQTPEGAFIAGPTFSQYGYAWLRDGAFIAEALDTIGESGLSGRFHDWVAGVVRGSAEGIELSIAAGRAGRRPNPADYLHCRYMPDGTAGPDDWPTFQLDGPGIWLWALGRHAAHGRPVSETVNASAVLVGRYLAALWDVPSSDAWEEFGDELHTSTIAADLAGLRALLAISPAARADPAIGKAVAAIEARLWAAGDGQHAWTKWAGSDEVDASLLWIFAPYELAAPGDARFAATLARIEAQLVDVDGGVHRYARDTYYGGGAWPLLTAALGQVYLRRGESGDLDRARRCLAWIEAQAGPDGALPEQVATHALHPDRIAEWRTMWGESASPLLWSHATHLALRAAISAAEPGDARRAGATEREE